MYPENPEGTQVIVGSMNMGYISDTSRNRTHNLFRPKREPIPLGHSDVQAQWRTKFFEINSHQSQLPIILQFQFWLNNFLTNQWECVTYLGEGDCIQTSVQSLVVILWNSTFKFRIYSLRTGNNTWHVIWSFVIPLRSVLYWKN